MLITKLICEVIFRWTEMKWVEISWYGRKKISRICRTTILIDHVLSCVKVCHLLRGGVAAIFGPQSAHTASHVQSICDTMEIPHLETRWDYRLRRQSCLVNLYPHPTTLSKVRIQTWGIIASLKRQPPQKMCLRDLPFSLSLSSVSWISLDPRNYFVPHLHRRINIAFLCRRINLTVVTLN